MFNKKLKERIEALEEELGIAYNHYTYDKIENGLLSKMKLQSQALERYLEIENVSKTYGSYEYKEKKEK